MVELVWIRSPAAGRVVFGQLATQRAMRTSSKRVWGVSARSIVKAGIAAGVISTLVQIVLWVLFTDAFPAILFRDARLVAAIAIGPSVLQSAEGFDVHVVLIATVVHFTLSIAFAAALSVLVTRCSMPQALASGAAFGVALYVVNLHLMTSIFPWFDVSRGAITLAAHVAFGVSAAAVLRRTSR
jgi:hypothetical protein